MKGKHTFESSLEVNVPVEKLFGWHENVGAFERLTPSFDPVTVKKRLGEGIDGGEVHIKLPYLINCTLTESRFYVFSSIRNIFSK